MSDAGPNQPQVLRLLAAADVMIGRREIDSTGKTSMLRYNFCQDEAAVAAPMHAIRREELPPDLPTQRGERAGSLPPSMPARATMPHSRE
jgi:hypothetical protein